MSLDSLTPDQVRDLGMLLNGGRSYGWRKRLVVLTGASAYTVRSWCDAIDTATHRPCSGPAARLLRMLAHLQAKYGAGLDAYLETLDGTQNDRPNLFHD